MKTAKNFFFVSGLPRAGSTLLMNILAQNPEIHATATSGILGMMHEVRNYWHNIDEFKAMPEAETEKRKIQCIRGMLEGYYADVKQSIVAEKSRGWLSHLEMASLILQGEPKVLVPVRDLRDVLCSFEKLYRKTKDTRQLYFEKQNPVESQTMAGRMALWSRKGDVVGSCFDRISDAVTRGWRKQMFFVDYEDLTKNPEKVLNDVYDFLKLKSFKHNFTKVEQVTVEDDLTYVWKDLHKIRPVVAEQEPQWPILMEKNLSELYADQALFWRKWL